MTRLRRFIALLTIGLVVFTCILGIGPMALAANPLGVTVAVGTPTAGAVSTYDISFAPANPLSAGSGSVTVDFVAPTSAPLTLQPQDISVTIGSPGPTTTVTTLTSVSATHVVFVPPVNMPAGTPVTVHFLNNGAGRVMTNPTAAGANYTVTITTSADAASTSGAYTITPAAPAVANSTVGTTLTRVPANNSATATITVTVQDSFNNPRQGDTISLSGGVGSHATVTAVSATTNAGGQASFTVKDGTGEAVTFTATDSSTGTTIGSVQVTFTAPVSSANSTVQASSTRVPADNTTTATVTVTARDASNNPIIGDTITLAANAGASATVTTLSGTTNVSGQATFSIKDGTAETVVFTATDTSGGNQTVGSVQVIFGQTVGGGSGVSASLTRLPANNSTTTSITVTVKDTNNNAIVGDTITLSTGAGPTLSAGSLTTNASGQAVFTARSGTAGTFIFTATDTTGGGNQTIGTVQVTFSPLVSTLNSTVGASPTAVTADGSSTATVTVTVKDGTGNPIAGDTVTLSGTGSSTITAISNTTNGSGQASFSVKNTHVESVTYTASDITGGVVQPIGQVGVNFTAGSINTVNSTVSANAASVLADGTTPVTVTVTVKDSNNNPVSGQAVSLAAGGGSSVIGNPNATSNGSGVATFTVTDTKAEQVTYTASVNGSPLTPTVTVSFTAGAFVRLLVLLPGEALAAGTQTGKSGTPNTAFVGTPFTATVYATDVRFNPVSGVSDNVTLTSSDGQFSPFGFALNNGVATPSVTLRTTGSQWVRAADSNGAITTSTSSNVTVSGAAASSLSLSAPGSATANAAFNVTLTARDPFGNTAAGYQGTVHFTSSDGLATLPPDYTFTANDNGVHTFTVTLRSSGSRSLTATDTGQPVVTGSASVNVGGGSGTPSLVLTASSSSVSLGGSFNLTVTAYDAFNNVNTSYNSTVHFSSSDGLAILPSNYSFQPGDFGSHTFAGVTLRTAGTQSITVNDLFNGSLTNTIAVLVQSASNTASLSVTTSSTTVQVGGGVNVTVTAKDSFGNVATGYGGTVRFTSTDSQATLPPNYTFQPGDAGVHTFTGVVLRTSGSQTITATDLNSPAITGTSPLLTVMTVVSGGPAAYYQVTSSSNFVGLGTPFSITVIARDVFGNNSTSYTGTVRFISNDPLGTLPANYTFRGSDMGIHTFTGVVLRTAGQISITAVDYFSPTISGSIGSVTVATGGTPSTLTLTPSVSSTGSGTSFNLTVTVKDVLGTTVTGYSGTVRFSSTDPAATLPGNYTFQPFDVGSHTFTGVVLRTQGAATITATDLVSSSVTGTSTAVSVTGGSNSNAVLFSVVPSVGSTSAGAAFNLTVTAKDAYGNTATGYTGSVRFTSTDPSATVPLTYTFQPGDFGTHTFTGAVLRTQGVAAFTAIDVFTPSITGTSPGISVSAGSSSGNAVLFSVVPSVGSTSAGAAFNLTVAAKDAYGNTATGYTGSVRFTSTDPSATVPLTYTFQPGDFGTHTFTGAVLRTQGVATVTAIDVFTPGITGTSPGISVLGTTTGGTAVLLSVVPSVSNTSAGASFSLSVTARDAFGNTASGYTGTVRFASSDLAATLPAYYTFQPGDFGAHTFTGVVLRTQGVATITAADLYSPAVAGTSTGISVTGTTVGGTATQLSVVPSVASTSANSPFSITVTARDALGNIASGYTGTVRFSTTDLGPVLPASYSFQPADAGVHTFIGVILRTQGVSTITATDTYSPAISGTSPGITVIGQVSSGTAVSFGVVPSVASISGGNAFTVTVTARDAVGNTATGYTGSVRLSSSDPAATLPAMYTFSAFDAGQHLFNVTLRTAGTQTITASDLFTPSITGTSTGISISSVSGTVATVRVTGPTSALPGQTVSFTATASNSSGLPVTTAFTWSASGGTMNNGTWTAPATAGTYQINAVTGGITGSLSVAVGGGGGTAATVSITPAGPQTVQAGQTLQFSYTARDAQGNAINGTPIWTVSGVGSAQGGAFSSTRAGRATVSVSINGSTGSSGQITVTAGAVRSVSVSASSTQMTTGGVNQFTATVSDAYGNAISNVPVTWSASTGTINSNGFYFAGSTPGSATITATGYNGATPVTGSATVNVVNSGGSSGGTGGGTGGSTGGGGSGGTGGSGPGTTANGCAVIPNSQALPPDAQAATTVALVNCPGTWLVTFGFQTTFDTKGLLAYYYDSRWSTWIAVPTGFGLAGTATAWMQGTVPIVLMRTPRARQPGDLYGTWADPHVLKLESLSIMQGYPDGGFHPDELINRYTAAKTFALAMNLDITHPDYTLFNQLSDRAKIPADLKNYVAAVLNANVMIGTGPNGFLGELILTRAQMATIIGRVIRTGIEGPIDFSDALSIPVWARSGVGRSVAYHIVDGFEDHTFRPDWPLTRAQFAKMVSQLLDALNPPPWGNA